MQNRYVGDVGDFGKYGILRSIGETGLKLGVNWYLTPDESHNSDGKHTSYLYKENYCGYDDQLFYILKDIVENDRRNVISIQESAALSGSTVFYDCVLNVADERDYLKRRVNRQLWHKTALSRLNDCEIIFLDPDNGLQVDSVSLTGQKGNKYIGLDELKDYYKQGKSIIFYNHRERKQEDAYLEKFRKLQVDPAFTGAVWLGLKFVRGTTRDYFFVLQPEHLFQVKSQCEVLLNTVWKECFSWLCL